MNEDELPPPPPELALLFRAEARFPDEPAERREHVRASLLLAMASSASAAGASSAASGKLGVSSVSLWFGAGGLVVGLVAGASIAWPLALSTRSSEAPPSAPTVSPAAELPDVEPAARVAEATPAIAPPHELTASAERLQPEPPQPSAGRRPERVVADREPNETPADRRGGQLRAERTILDAARAAIDDRDPARALAALDRHGALEGPRSLDEEAEALRIIALALAGRSGEASAARERFRTRFEGSVFTPAIDRATSSAR